MRSLTTVITSILLIATVAFAETSGSTGSSWSLGNLWRGALIGAIIGYFAGRKWKSR